VASKSSLRWTRILTISGVAALIATTLLAWPFIADRPLPAAKSAAPTPASPFVGIDTSKLSASQRSAISQAEVDFLRTLKGLPPLCKATPDSGYSDGGTVIYECEKYRLMVMRQLFTLQGVDGYLYGPVLSFGSDQPMSDVRFYTPRELSLLLNEPAIGGL